MYENSCKLETLFHHMKGQLEGVKTGWDLYKCFVYRLFPSPSTCLKCGRVIYAESGGTIPQYTVSLLLGFVTY